MRRQFHGTLPLRHTALAAWLVGSAAPLQAQTVEPIPGAVVEVEEVVVTGLRSIATSGQDVKQANLAFVDSRTAEEIARLPDVTLAEALDRIVGFNVKEVLPNAQLWFDLPSDWRIRAAYTEALARPDFSDFAMGQRTSFDGNGFPVINGSNPYLEPRLAQNYDLGVERYFSDGFVSLGVFYKELENETFLQRRETRNDQNVVILTEQTPLNTGSASVTGVEASLAIDRLTWLPAPFEGFGIDANYTYLHGEWNVVFTDGSRRTVGGLRNQPKWLANLNLSYRYSRLELDLGWRLCGRTFTGKFGVTEAGDNWIDNYDRGCRL